ncbi:uncharacterized protein LODBEIA_P56370 [Lodderomyces beijingensis]|uniref:Topoisomerase 1-associated factor 1 n=1 Tax=Lodderomyces beijingensis TaxID=1775926 RepID=A0ABP0ZTE9_9ASCO
MSSDSETNSDIENFSDAQELDDFIAYSEDEEADTRPHETGKQQEPANIDNKIDSFGSDEEPQDDRIRQLTTSLKPNESQAQKLLKAHIAVLVSALGGIDHTSAEVPAPYKLGHDALACLKDIKRWIKAVDEKQNNYEVALACAESGLVQNDLIVILCQWENQMQRKEAVRNKVATEKIMLSCLEILVLLTWPVDYGKNLSENQKLLFGNVCKYHLLYKYSILTYNDGQLLKAIIRLALPVIAKSRIDREPRDNQILRLVMFFVRNLLAIEPPTNSVSSKTRSTQVSSSALPAGVSHDDISLGNMLRIFKKNKVLMLLLTISGSINTEFDKDLFGEICLECVYLIIKGLECKEILVPNPAPTVDTSATTPLVPLSSTVGLQLQDLLATEAKKRQAQTQNIATRHGKFGTLLSIRSADQNSYVVSGEEALITANGTLEKMDKSKTWKHQNHFKYDSDEFVKTNSPVYLNSQGRHILQRFIDEFLSGGCFNNLIESMGSKLTSQSEGYSTTDELTQATYFFTIAWFLNYKREQHVSTAYTSLKTFDFGAVRAALSEVNFILIVAYCRDSHAKRLWNSLHVAVICLKELMQISNSIFGKKRPTSGIDRDNDDDDDADSQYEIDRELAEGIIRKLFSFQDFLSLLILIPQSAHKHSPRFLAESIRVITIVLKAFESFAKEDLQLYVQTKRRRSKAKRARVNELDRDNESKLRAAIYESDEELAQENLKEVTRERRLNFQATEVRFFHQGIVTTYIEYLSRFEDLTHQDVKMCLSYFHKLFVVRKDYSGLFRLDFMQMLVKLKTHLPQGSSIRAQVEEFIYYFMKKFKAAIARFPNVLEILFPRFEDSSLKCYLATGELYESDTANSNREFSKQKDGFASYTGANNEEAQDEENDGFDEDIAFEIAANPNAVNHASQLDQLDELESQLNSHQKRHSHVSSSSSSSLEKGKAQKRKSKSKSKSTNKNREQEIYNGEAGHRRRRVPKDLLEDIHTLKSTEYIHDSDDDSDDERNAEFFAKEERLRQLLSQTGSITDAQKLEEFKKVWTQYSKIGGATTENVVANAVKEVSLFVDEDDRDEQDAEERVPNLSSILVQKHNSHSSAASDSSSDDDDDKNEHAREDMDSHSQHSSDTSVGSETGKRPRIESEDDDDDEEEEKAGGIHPSAHPTKKRLVIEDDEDDF